MKNLVRTASIRSLCPLINKCYKSKCPYIVVKEHCFYCSDPESDKSMRWKEIETMIREQRNLEVKP